MNCEYYFGLSGINSALIKQFYPEDLPSDWRISYYSNEFELLIIHCSDLLLSAQSDAVSAEEITEQLSEIIEDINESSVLLFDCADLSDAVQQQLYNSQISGDNQCRFINTALIDNTMLINHYLQLEWGSVISNDSLSGGKGNNKALFCHVKSTKSIKPVELKQLLETMDKYTREKDIAIINVFFSHKYALENCRNAVLLESMM